ncbi:helix-turn-helix transcriptional regulator [Streptomyces virginiae]|uniref:helix-turn-helix transcriptional regulator n=1 Tax=Streptomyces virginiae TaxID=1961 RepID=UPI003438F9CF
MDLSDPPAVFRAAAASLASDDRDRPFLLLVDDVHLLDATSAMLLSQLMDAEALFLVATARDQVPMSEAVGAIDRADGLPRIDVTPLDCISTEDLLTAALGSVVEKRTVLALHDASGGNPLFLRELVLGAVERGELVSTDRVWRLTGRATATSRLVQGIETRLSGLPPASLGVLELLSLVEPAGVGELETPADEGTLELLERGGLIRVQRARRRITVTLAHPLYSEVLRDRLPPYRRRQTLGAHIERVVGRGARRHDDALRIATWQLSAGISADPGLLVQAAGLARYGHDYEQVLSLLEAVPEDRRTVATYLLEGEALYELGRFDEAEKRLAEAYRMATSDEDRAAITMERTQNLCWGTSELERALAVNVKARSRITDPGLRDALGVNEGAMRILAGRPEEGLAQLDDPGSAADERVRLYGLGMKVLGLAAVGRTAEAVELGRRAHEEHELAGEHLVIQHHTAALSALALAHAAAGDLESARLTAERGHQLAVSAGATQPGVWLAWGLARTHWLAGRLADARRWYAEALALARSEPVPIILRLAASGLAASSALLGDIVCAQDALEGFDGYPDFPFLTGEDRLGEAWLLASRGQLRASQEVVLRAADRARQAGYASSEMLLLTEAARMGAAPLVQDRLCELAKRCDGVFAAVRSRFATALSARDGGLLATASQELESMGALLLAAEAAAAAAHAFSQDGQSRAATRWAATAAALRERCQGASSPGFIFASPATPLTPRELEIALMASHGSSSKEIAALLVLSVRTVDNNLQHIYRKLGITSRTELNAGLGRR